MSTRRTNGAVPDPGRAALAYAEAYDLAAAYPDHLDAILEGLADGLWAAGRVRA